MTPDPAVVQVLAPHRAQRAQPLDRKTGVATDVSPSARQQRRAPPRLQEVALDMRT